MKTGDVAIGLAHLQLLQDVVPHLLRGAGSERRNRKIRKTRAQAAELAIVGAKFVAPLRNAVRLIDREKTHWNLAQPFESIAGGQSLWRKIEQAVFSARGFLHHLPALVWTLTTSDHRRRNAHLRQLCRLVLHQRDQ